MSQASNTDEYLAVLGNIAAERAKIEADLARVVWATRDAGASWAQIGTAIGVTKQAAQQKYATSNAEQMEAALEYAREVLARGK